MLSKKLLEPILPLVECLQGRLQDVYFGFNEITQHYQKIRSWTWSYLALDLSKQVDSEERMPQIIGRRQSRPNPSVTSPCDYWRVTVTIPFLEMKLSIDLQMTSKHILNFVHWYQRLLKEKIYKKQLVYWNLNSVTCRRLPRKYTVLEFLKRSQ